MSTVEPQDEPVDEAVEQTVETVEPTFDAVESAAVSISAPFDGSVRFAGGRTTPPRAALDDVRIHEVDPPERWMLVPLLVAVPPSAGDERYLLVRFAGVDHPSLLPMGGPAIGETLVEAVSSALQSRVGLRPVSDPRVSVGRVPVRLPQPNQGTSGPGWLRAVVVRVEGEPSPDLLVDEVLALPFDEAVRALPTDVERQVLALARE